MMTDNLTQRDGLAFFHQHGSSPCQWALAGGLRHLAGGNRRPSPDRPAWQHHPPRRPRPSRTGRRAEAAARRPDLFAAPLYQRAGRTSGRTTDRSVARCAGKGPVRQQRLGRDRGRDEACPGRDRAGTRRSRCRGPITATVSAPLACRAPASIRASGPSCPVATTSPPIGGQAAANACSSEIEAAFAASETGIACLVAEPIRSNCHVPPDGLWPRGPPPVRPARRAADLRRDPLGARQDRQVLRLRTFRHGARCGGAGQIARRRHVADFGGRLPTPGSTSRPNWLSATTRTRRTR